MSETIISSDSPRKPAKPCIVIGSPVRQESPIIEFFLRSLARLDTSDFDINYYFIDENDDFSASNQLDAFAQFHMNTMIQTRRAVSPYPRNETTHYWSNELIWKVAGFKEEIIEFARQIEADALFLIDSDLLLHPKTLRQLFHSPAQVVSEVFWTRWQPDSTPQPQVWLKDEYTQWHQAHGEQLDEDEIERRSEQFLAMLKLPGLYKVGGLGACTLIKKTSFAKRR